ncbi:MAG: hypothetical protein KBT03_07695 [Bacteroidales bacterium]|nr:hypothetical protein [Candidatus Scybalousia scybalohippi]
MKHLLNTILRTLKCCSNFRYIDTQWGQLDAQPPAVAFPCCLVDIESVEYEQLAHLGQTATCTISFTIGTSTLDNCPHEIFDLIEHLHCIIQGLSDKSFQPLQRTSLSHNPTSKDIDTYTITYTTAYTVTPIKKAEN